MTKSKDRKMVLRDPYLCIDGSDVTLVGYSTKNTRVEIRLDDFDWGTAYCAMRSLTAYLRKHIETQKQEHRSIRERARLSWAEISDAIKEETP